LYRIVCLDIAGSKFSSGGCKLSLLQKDLKLAINMSDAVDQPLHVSSAVNEVHNETCDIKLILVVLCSAVILSRLPRLMKKHWSWKIREKYHWKSCIFLVVQNFQMENI